MRRGMCGSKRKHPTYSAALAALEGVRDPELGSVYECPHCGAWHISSRRFTVAKTRGRGKSRRGVVVGV